MITSFADTSDDENQDSPKNAPVKHPNASGADMKEVLANLNLNELGMIIAACKQVNKWAAGFAKERAQRSQAARIAIAAALVSDLDDPTVLRRQFRTFM